jgi:hypothetical protein
MKSWRYALAAIAGFWLAPLESGNAQESGLTGVSDLGTFDGVN